MKHWINHKSSLRMLQAMLQLRHLQWHRRKLSLIYSSPDLTLIEIQTGQSFSGRNAIDTATLRWGLRWVGPVPTRVSQLIVKSFLFSPPGAHQAWHYHSLFFAAALWGHPHHLKINTATSDNEVFTKNFGVGSTTSSREANPECPTSIWLGHVCPAQPPGWPYSTCCLWQVHHYTDTLPSCTLDPFLTHFLRWKAATRLEVRKSKELMNRKML